MDLIFRAAHYDVRCVLRRDASSKISRLMKVEVMLWVLILAALALAIVSPRYRQYAVVVAGFAVVTVVAVIVLARKNEILTPPSSSIPAQRWKRVDFEELHIERLDKEDPEAKNHIAVSEIRFDQVRASTGSEPGTIESIRARLYNTSARFTLTDYAYYLVIQDCVEKACTAIYDQRGWGSATVPPNQARDVMIEIRTGETRESHPFKMLGAPKIILSPSNTRAYKAAS
jgi:hypothetical protein